MTHKVHPKSFRIKETADWVTRGFYGNNFTEYLKEDLAIRRYFEKKKRGTGIDQVEIERYPRKINIIISSARPGLLIGRGGEGAEVIKKEIEKILNRIKYPVTVKRSVTKREIRIEVNEVKDMWSSASLSSQWVSQELEKRMPFRRVIKDALEKITSQRGVEGARVEVAGRLNGADIARTEWLKKGKLPRQTIRAVIDYAQASAYCTYGVIGVKVWIYKGQKF